MAQWAIEPLYVTLTNGFRTRTGKIRFSVRGSDANDEDPDDESGEENDDEEESSEGSDGKKKESEEGSDSEADTLRKRLRAADKNNSKLQNRLKELEDKDKDEKTKATERAAELETKATEDAATISGLQLQVAFLMSNDQQWDDPEYALDFAQRKGYLDGVVDEEDGEIDRDALKKALEKLAKDKPSMIKKVPKDDDEEGDETPPATDQGVGNRRKNGKGKDRDEAVLAGKYPAAFR
jgi:hypothetical protein